MVTKGSNMKRLLSVAYLLLPVFMECAEVMQFPEEVSATPTTSKSRPIKIPVAISPKLLSEEFTQSVFACSLGGDSQVIVQTTSELLEEGNPLDKAIENVSPENKTPEEETSESSTAVASDGEDGVFTLDLKNS